MTTMMTRKFVLECAARVGYHIANEDSENEPCDEMLCDENGDDCTDIFIDFARVVESAVIEEMNKGI